MPWWWRYTEPVSPRPLDLHRISSLWVERRLARGLKPHALRRTAANRIDVASRLSVRTTAACRLFPSGEALFFTRANKIVAAAEQLAIPAMYFRREFALAGGLMSYGTNTDENFQVKGEYTGRILKGEKAGDLPIQQPTSFEFVINLKTSKALGINVPSPLLALATEVIE